MNAIFYRKSTKNLHESQCTHFFEIFSPQMLIKVWNSESPWKTTKKKCFQIWFLSPGRPSKPSLKALSAFIVASRTCEIFGPFRVRACVSCLASRFRPFGVVRTKNASRDKRKKCWRKIFFFVGEAPPSMLWNVPGTVLAACRQPPGVHAYIFVLPIFRFERTSSRTWEFLIVSGIMSCHVISSHLTDAGRHAQTVVAYTIKDKRSPGSLREPVLLEWSTEIFVHFRLKWKNCLSGLNSMFLSLSGWGAFYFQICAWFLWPSLYHIVLTCSFS